MYDRDHRRCLLVEDVAAMRVLLRTLLDDTGCKIVEAENLQTARQALHAHGAESFDFAVLDIDLPDGNGLELIPELAVDVRVIALTAYDSRETYLRCLNMGCDAVLSKGGQLAELRQMLMQPDVPKRASRRQRPKHRKMYFKYLAETLLELEKARHSHDFMTLRRIAHRLRGTAVHFGLPGIGTFAKSVSVALAAGRLGQVDVQTVALSTCIAEVLGSYQFNNNTHPARELVHTGSVR